MCDARAPRVSVCNVTINILMWKFTVRHTMRTTRRIVIAEIGLIGRPDEFCGGGGKMFRNYLTLLITARQVRPNNWQFQSHDAEYLITVIVPLSNPIVINRNIHVYDAII